MQGFFVTIFITNTQTKMNKPNVVLKNIKTFQGHDGIGLNADIWINGIKCMHVFDGAYGGQFEYTENTYNNPKAAIVKENIKLLDEYIDSLPVRVSSYNDKFYSIKVDRDIFINDIIDEMEKAKTRKKFEKLYQTAIVFGMPDGNKIQYMDYKRPLSEVSLHLLVNQIKFIQTKYCINGVQILNNNLESLGIQL